jgi:hypothetical protein
MRKGWKKLAERGDGKLHTAEQVRDAVPLALADDWREANSIVCSTNMQVNGKRI